MSELTTDIAARPRAVAFAADLGRFGAAPAIVDPSGEVLTYRELHDRVDAARGQLPSERSLVMIEGGNHVPAIVAHLAALAAGHVVLLAPPAAADALQRTFGPHCVARAASGWEDFARLHEHPLELHPDLALLLTTSGSTGSAKVVRLSHTNVESNASAIASYLGLTARDRGITSLPLHYCYGLSVLHSHLAVGASVALTDLSVSDPCFWRQFESSAVTGLAGVPYTFDLLDAIGFDGKTLPSLRYVTQAGGRLDPSAVLRYAELGRRRGWDFYVMYGQTEATSRMAYLPPELTTRAPGSIGVPIPGGEFHIDAPDDEGAGELVFRGPNVMLGYADTAEHLAAGRSIDELRTGDLARRTDDGLYEIVGRKSRFLKIFGLRIDLDTVERLVESHGFEHVLCTGSDTQLVVACTYGTRAQADRLRDRVSRRLGLPLSTIAVVDIDRVPRLPSGKPDYQHIRELAAAAPHTEADIAHGATVRDIYALFARRAAADIAGDDTFVSLGGDSLSYVEAATRLEAALGSLPDAWHLMTVDALEAHPRGNPQTPLRRPFHARMETNVVLRAVAMVLIVGSHITLFEHQGGAHVLLAIAGYNFARFVLPAGGSLTHLRRMGRVLGRIALPAWLWLAVQFTYSEPLTWQRLLWVNNYAGSGLWEYWYIEAILQLLLLVTVAFAWSPIRALERRHPFPLAFGALAGAVALRWARADLGYDELLYRPDTLLWLFALGWAAQRATTARQQALVVALGAISLWEFFDKPGRAYIAAGGLLALVTISHLRVPRPLVRPITAVAAASLWLFLTHWAFQPLARTWPPFLVFALALATGVAANEAATRLGRLTTRDRNPSVTTLAGYATTNAAP